MKKYCLLSVCLLLLGSAQAQLRVSPLAPSAVPTALRRSGRVVQALRYTDRTGTYTVLATEMGPRPTLTPLPPAARASAPTSTPTSTRPPARPRAGKCTILQPTARSTWKPGFSQNRSLSPTSTRTARPKSSWCTALPAKAM